MIHFQTLARFVLLLVLPGVLLLACAGGGTSGTGLKTFSGVARTPSGLPVPGVEVAVAGTDAQSVTMEDGTYVFQAELGAGTVQVDVANEGQTNSVEVPDLPEGDADVTIDIAVDEETRAATAVSVAVQSRNDDTPSENNNPGEPSPGPGNGEESQNPEEQAPSLTLVTGILLGADGLPLAGVPVFSEALGVTVITDESGAFSIEGLVEGESLFLSIGDTESHTQTAIALDENTSSVSLVLQENTQEDGSTNILAEISEVEIRDQSTPEAEQDPEEEVTDIEEENVPGEEPSPTPSSPPIQDPEDTEEEEEAPPGDTEVPEPEVPIEENPDLPVTPEPSPPGDNQEEEEFAP